MTTPPVTIIIPAYNYATFLADAVTSALAQDYAGELEVLVIDDGSTDGTPGIAASFGPRIRYHRKVNGGLSAARNTGMEMASHQLVVFLDADDMLEPDAVRRMVQARHGGAKFPVVVGAVGRMIDSEGRWISEVRACEGGRSVFSAEDFVLRNRFAPIVLADRQALLGLGGFDPELKASEDRDMWIRASAVGHVAMVDECLHRKRDHGANMSRHATRQTEAILQVLAKARRNPALSVAGRTWREAEAICLFQSARMHLSAGDRITAMKQCVRSLWRAPWLRHAASVGYPLFFRIRFLVLQMAALPRMRRGSTGAESPAQTEDKKHNDPHRMKDIVENRRRLAWGQKLQLGALAVRENGLLWTLLLGIYGGASAVASAAHGGMQRLRLKRGIPGMNSREMNRLIWENWDWSGGGDEWTPSEEWKTSLIRGVLRPCIPPGADVVEIGPGGGRWTGALISACRSYRGLDISQSCVALCREKFGMDSRASFDVTDGRSLPGVSDNAVDLVWSFDVFVHINAGDLDAYLHEIHRILKPGGKAVIHHGSVAGERGGWRSDVTTSKFNQLAAAADFEVLSQIGGWQDGADYHRAGLYEDLITTILKPANV